MKRSGATEEPDASVLGLLRRYAIALLIGLVLFLLLAQPLGPAIAQTCGAIASVVAFFGGLNEVWGAFRNAKR